MYTFLWSNSEYIQGGVTPIDSIVTAATTGQNFDRLSSAVWPLTTLILAIDLWPLIFWPQRSLNIWTATQVNRPVCQEISAPWICNLTQQVGENYSTVIWSVPHWDLNIDRFFFYPALTVDPAYSGGLTIDRWLSAVAAVTIESMGVTPPWNIVHQQSDLVNDLQLP